MSLTKIEIITQIAEADTETIGLGDIDTDTTTSNVNAHLAELRDAGIVEKPEYNHYQLSDEFVEKFVFC